MRVVFLNPPLHLARDFIDYPYFGNLGLLQAAAACRERGFHVTVVDAFAQPDSDLTELPSEHAAESAAAASRPGAAPPRGAAGPGLALGSAMEPLVAATARADPDAVVVLHSAFVHPRTVGAAHLDELLERLRQRLGATPLILADCATGGMHYREYAPEAVLQRTGADYLCRYEAEEALPALLSGLAGDRGTKQAGRTAKTSRRRGTRRGKADASRVTRGDGRGEGQAVKDEASRIVRGEGEVDLEQLPPPAFDLIDGEAYQQFLERCFTSRLRVPLFPLQGRTLPLLLSRGCPYRCIFCTSNPGLGPGEPKRRRRVTPARAEQLFRHTTQELGARTVVILDELANFDDEAFTALLELARDLDVRLEIPNGLRADRLTRGHLELLQGRTSQLSISPESGSQRVVDEVVRKRQDLAEVRRVAADCHELGIPLLAHFMIGLPGERRAEALETLRFAWELHERHGVIPSVQFATPLEGSPLWQLTDGQVSHDGDLAAQLQVRPVITGTEASPEELAAAKLMFETRLDAERTAKLILNLSYRCNNSCLFCAVGDRGAAAGSPKDHQRILWEHRRQGIRLLDLDGGEPTLVPHLLPLVRYARQIGYERISVTTNGRRLSYDKFAAALMTSGITDLLISLHAPTAEAHEELTRAPGSFAQTVAGVEHAVRLNRDAQVDIGINTTLSTQNYRLLPELAALVLRLGVRKLNVQFVTPFGRARPEIVPDPAVAAEVVRQVIEEHGDRLQVNVINLPFCYLPGLESHVVSDLYKHQRNMVFVSQEEVNLFDYLAATREHRAECTDCLRSIGCDGFYSFATSHLAGIRPEREEPAGEAPPPRSAPDAATGPAATGASDEPVAPGQPGPREPVAPGQPGPREPVAFGQPRPRELTASQEPAPRAAPAPEAKPVRLVDVMLGYRCNSSCIFCSVEDHLRSVNSSAAKVATQIRDSLAYHPEAIRFGGGEPTVWPELPELVALSRELGFAEIAVQTNGYLLGEDDLGRRLLDAGMNKLNISLRGADARTYDALTRTPGSFDRVMAGLAAVRRVSPGLHVEGDVIVTRQTLPQLAEIVRELGPKGIRKFNFWYVAIEGRVRGRESKLVPRLTEVTKPLLEALQAADDLGLQAAQAYYVPYCFLPGRADRVWDPKDEKCLVVTPQTTFRLELGEIDLGVKTPRCQGCRYEAHCFGVRPGYIERFGDHEIFRVT